MKETLLKKKDFDLTKIFIYLLFIVIAIMFIGPILWMISLSLKTKEEIFSYPPKIFPERLAFENYLKIITASRIPLYLWNSVKITFLAVAGNLIVIIPAVFAFSRMRFAINKVLLFIILMFQMISPLIISIPLYRYFVKIGLFNSFIGMVMIYITIQIPFSVWLLKGFFDSIPKELDESALIDGCGPFQTLLNVILPLAMPGIAAVVIFNVTSFWGQFIIPYIFVNQSEKFPIAVGILQYLQSQTEGEVTIHLLASASVLALIPAIAVIFILQKFIVQVLVAGAVKE